MRSAIVGLDHVQVAAPVGCEEDARRFYGVHLGLKELEKPPLLATRGGVWFRVGEQQLHVGVADRFVPAAKAHPALRVSSRTELDLLAARLEEHGIEVGWADPRRSPEGHDSSLSGPLGQPDRARRVSRVRKHRFAEGTIKVLSARGNALPRVQLRLRRYVGLLGLAHDEGAWGPTRRRRPRSGRWAGTHTASCALATSCTIACASRASAGRPWTYSIAAASVCSSCARRSKRRTPSVERRSTGRPLRRDCAVSRMCPCGTDRPRLGTVSGSCAADAHVVTESVQRPPSRLGIAARRTRHGAGTIP